MIEIVEQIVQVGIEQPVVTIIEAVIPGPPGTPGADGADSTVPGPPGPPGSGNFSYVHDQMSPASVWTIVHGLSGYPNITIVDSSQREVVGDVIYVDSNTISVTFSSAFAGKAYLS